MVAQYGQDLCDRIIASSAMGLSKRQISQRFFLSTRFVSKVRRRFRITGQSWAMAWRPGRPFVVPDRNLQDLRDVAKQNSSFFLYDISNEMIRFTGHRPAISTTYRALVSRLGFSFTRIRNDAIERDEVLRIAWQQFMSEIPTECLVFYDESYKDSKTENATYGWGPIGERIVRQTPFVRGTRLSLLAALDETGVFAHDVIEGSCNAERFLDFLQDELIIRMNPFPGPRSVLVMDNCSFHHNEQVKRMCKQAGIVVYYLPPYSPDLNPIEFVFGTIKQWLRAHEELVRSFRIPQNAVTTAVNYVNSLGVAKKYINHCGNE